MWLWRYRKKACEEIFLKACKISEDKKVKYSELLKIQSNGYFLRLLVEMQIVIVLLTNCAIYIKIPKKRV